MEFLHSVTDEGGALALALALATQLALALVLLSELETVLAWVLA